MPLCRLFLLRNFRTEASFESPRTLSALQWIHNLRGRKNSKPHKLRPELVADVHGLRGRPLQVQIHLSHRMAGSLSHPSGGVFLDGGQFRRRVSGRI